VERLGAISVGRIVCGWEIRRMRGLAVIILIAFVCDRTRL
jgi:hypothetical protein